MKKTIQFLLVLLVPTFAYAQQKEPIKINIDPTVHYQTIDGFGASDAWRAQFVGKNLNLSNENKKCDTDFANQVDVYTTSKKRA